MRNAIRNRYSLLQYYYTSLFKVSSRGGTFYKPLFYTFPDDTNAYRDFEYNIMLGSSLKLGVLSNRTGVNSTEFYYPAGVWCNLYNNTDPCFTSTGEYIEQRALAYDFYVHLREGNIVPF